MQLRLSSSMCGVLVVVLLGAVACGARPPRSDPAYGDLLPESDPMDVVGNSIGRSQGENNHLLPSISDDNLMAAIRMRLLQQYTNYLKPRDQFLNAPQDKRQSRYRQCYFNPISCFRK